MSKKEKNLAHAAHIKRHTAGTSNELSFSVLDAAKSRADAGSRLGDQSQIPGFGKVRVFTPPAGVNRKKTPPTPTKDAILPLSSGETIVSPAAGGVRSGNTSALDLGYSLPHVTSGIPRVAPAPSRSAPGIPRVAPGPSRTSPGMPRVAPPPKSKKAAKSAEQEFRLKEEEVERRKARRRKRRNSRTVLSTLVVIAIIGVGGFYLFREVLSHQEQVSLLDQSLARIEEVNDVIITIDEIVNNTNMRISTDNIRYILSQIPKTNETLNVAEVLAKQAGESMRDSIEKEAADRTILCIEARRDILTVGETLLLARIGKAEAEEAFDLAWRNVLVADSLARDAALLVANSSVENVTASRQKTEEAYNLLYDAYYVIYAIANSELKPDLQVYLDYVAKRAESMQHAIASDDAILAHDRETAVSRNEAYNKAEDEAAQLARRLPSVVLEPIQTAYTRSITEPMKIYEQARSQASRADSFLRDYLGTGNK